MTTYAKINGQQVPITYYDPSGQKRMKGLLGDIGEVLGPEGLGALGIAPLLLAGGLFKILFWSGAAWVGYKGYTGLSKAVGGPKGMGAFVEGLFEAAPFVAGGVIANYAGKHGLPPRFAKHRWIPVTALTGYGVYRFVKRMRYMEPKAGNYFTIGKVIKPVGNIRLSKAWTQARMVIGIKDYMPSVRETSPGSGTYNYNFNLKLQNMSDRDYELMVYLYAANIAEGTGLPVQEPKVGVIANPRMTLKANSTQKWTGVVSDAMINVRKKERGKLTYKFIVYLLSDKNFKWPVLISKPITLE